MKTEAPDQLRLLALVGRHGTLAAAADALGITPAAATQRLARAERDWGAALVTRSTRGASLTPAGAVLASYGEAVDRQVTAATDAFDSFRGKVSRRLRIGAFQAAALHLLPPALTSLRHRHPDSDVSVVDMTSERATGVVGSGDLDLAVLATWDSEPLAPAGVHVERLLTDPMVVVLPDDHPLAGSSAPLRLRQLRDETWVVIRAGHAAREQLDRAAALAGFTPHVRFETESYDVAQALVGTGIGVALVSRLALASAPGTLARPLRSPHLERRIHVAVPEDRSLTPLTGTFLRLLHDVADDVREGWRQTPLRR